MALVATLVMPSAAGAATTLSGVHTYSANTTWTAAGSPYLVASNAVITVNAGVTLTVEPGVVVKFGAGRRLTVKGTLLAEGTSSAPIVFTSIEDDVTGGDDGGDGPTVGARGQWRDLYFPAGGTGFFSHVVVQYGGNSYVDMIYVASGAAITFEDSVAGYSAQAAIHVTGEARIRRSELLESKWGIRASQGRFYVEDSEIHHNFQYGINFLNAPSTGSAGWVRRSSLHSNTNQGFYTTTTVAATYWPVITQSNFYGNNSGGTQAHSMYDPELNHGTPPIWDGNYWGPDAVNEQNPASCNALGRKRPASVVYPSSTATTKTGPIRYGSTYHSGTRCRFDYMWDRSPALSPIEHDDVPTLQALGGCGGGWHAPNPSLCDGGVNSATGNFTHSATDVKLPGLGVPLEFTRQYNSLDPVVGPMGRGWSHAHDARLEQHPDGSILLHGEDGQKVRFYPTSTSTYVSLGGGVSASDLVAVTGGFELTHADRTTYSFDSQGRITSKVDRNGNGITYAYDTAGLLETITDEAGRTLQLTYDTAGLLTGIAVPGSRSVAFSYTDGRLVSVTDLRGGTTTYAYSTTYDALQSETNQRGKQVFRNVYDSTGRVIERYDAFDNKTEFAWNESTQTSTRTDPAGKVWTEVYDGNRLVSQTDPTNATTTYGYNDSHLNTSITDPRGHATTMTYDSAGNLSTKTAPSPLSYSETWVWYSDRTLASHTNRRGKTTTYTYDSAGNLVTTTRPGSNVTTYTRNSTNPGLVDSETDPRGKTTTYGYDADFNRTSVTSPLGHQTTMAYDSSGRMTSKVEPRGNASGATASDYQTTFTYDNADNKLTETDPLGNVTTWTYTATNRAATVEDAEQDVTTYGYNDADQVTTVTAPDTTVTTTTYDVRGLESSVTTPEGAKTTFTYDDARRPLTRVDPLGNETGAIAANYTWTYGYDASGNRTNVTDPEGGVVQKTYDALNRLSTVTDERSKTTTYAYDGNGNRTSVTDPRSADTVWAFDDLDRVSTITDPLNAVTTLTHDAGGNLTSRERPTGGTESFTYDDDGRKASRVEERGNESGATAADYTWSYTYDAAGNLIEQTSPLGHSTEWTFDRAGRRSATTDQRGKTTSFAHDGVDRLTSVTAPGNLATTYAYDAVGNLITRTDAKSHVTTYGYDDDRRMTSVESHTGQEWTSVYDANGNRTTLIDANGNAALDPAVGTTQFTFDGVGRITAVNYPSGTDDITISYDLAGNRTGLSDGAGSASFGYDDASNLTSATRGSDQFSWAYDLASEISSRTYPDSATTSYTRNDDGQILTATQNSSTTTYAYDPAGNLLTTTLPSGNGHVETRTWDRDGRLAEISNDKGSTTLSRATITRDGAGNPTQVVTEHGTETYAYDDLGRITEACYQSSCPNSSDPFIRYTYDDVGNRLTEERPTGTVDYTYNAADQLTSTDDGTTVTSYTYDANGNELTSGAVTRQYDAENRVTSHDDGTTTTTYSYDGDGNRINATIGTAVTNYQWDINHDLPQLALETDDQDALIRRYIYGNQRISSTTPSGTSYYHYGLLGSVTDVTDATGTAEHSYTYDPFGNDRGATSASGAPDNPMRYTGEYLDAASEDYHLRARDYDPTTGRFHSTDPVMPSIDDPYVSSYVYANNRPTVLVDPSGKIVQLVPIGLRLAHVARQLAPLATRVIAACSLRNGLNLSGCVAAYRTWRDTQTILLSAATTRVAISGSATAVAGASLVLQSRGSSEPGGDETETGGDTQPGGEESKPLNPVGGYPGAGSDAKDIEDFAEGQGWTRTQTENGPPKYVDENGVVRVTIKRGSSRTPGSEGPHVEYRDAQGRRVDPNGNPVARRSPGNHTPINL